MTRYELDILAQASRELAGLYERLGKLQPEPLEAETARDILFDALPALHDCAPASTPQEGRDVLGLA